MSDRPIGGSRALALHQAFCDGDLGRIRSLLGDPEGFPDVDAGPGFGRCLGYAIHHGPVALVASMLELGADPNVVTVVDEMETPLEIASAAGHADVVDRLGPLTTRLDWEAASRADEVATLRRLLDEGQNIDATDGFGQTALMRAAHAGAAGAVEFLLARGAMLDHSAKFGLTALMLAVIQGHHRIARALLAAGADLRAEGSGAPGFAGKTAADLAADRGERRLAEDLRPR